MKKYLSFLILSSCLSAQSPLYSVPAITGAIASFALATSLGSDLYLECPGTERQFSCCHRIFNTTLAQVINGPCFGSPNSEPPECSDSTSVTCISDNGIQSTPQVGTSPGLIGGIVPAIIFWIAAHGLLANAWLHQHTHGSVLEDNESTCFRSAQCTKQSWQVFTRYFLTTFLLSLDLISPITAFTGYASPKKVSCAEGMTCCTPVSCETSLSALKPVCNLGTDLECVAGNSLTKPPYVFTTTSLALGITTSVMLGASIAFGALYSLHRRYAVRTLPAGSLL